MKYLIGLFLLLAGVASAQQSPSWRDYYAASGAPEASMKAAADLDLFKAQMTLRKETNELLSVSFAACQRKVMKSCVDAALAIATLERIDTQWILKHHMHMDELQADLDNFEDMSRQIERITG